MYKHYQQDYKNIYNRRIAKLQQKKTSPRQKELIDVHRTQTHTLPHGEKKITPKQTEHETESD